MINIAIDLGGTRTKVGILKEYELLSYSVEDSFSQDSFSVSLTKLTDQINKLLADNSVKADEINGVGLAFPGIVDTVQNKVISTNEKFNQAIEFDFYKWAKDNWNAKFKLENDARAAIIGEWQFGIGKGIDNLVMMTIGTGIGGVCLIEGKLLHGKHFQAGVLGGHSTIDYHGGKCTCGNIGCVESEASTWKLKELITNHKMLDKSILSKAEVFDFKTLFDAARKKDEIATELMKRSLSAWAAGVVNLIHAYDPEMVILHGGVMKSSDIIIPFIQSYVDDHAWTPWGKVKVVKSSSPDFAALWGMNYLCSSIKEK
ncbi:Glucokinase [hydrothermal vent metagenome]|uniref:Glucokinase n=1 Tax=hydrothermal vent metagenome TaxID=652676 RepID=A0A3B1CI42_9ZZZZ